MDKKNTVLSRVGNQVFYQVLDSEDVSERYPVVRDAREGDTTRICSGYCRVAAKRIAQQKLRRNYV